MSGPSKGWKHFIVHGVLNQPERQKAPEPEAAPAAEKWAKAGEAVATTKPEAAPWHIEDDRSAGRFVRKLVKGAVVAGVVLFAWVGLRTAVQGDYPEPALELPASVSFDRTAAAGVGERFATSFLTWEEGKQPQHAEAVALDFYAGASDLGWNGKGKQAVRSAIAADVTVDPDGTEARVLVFVDVVTYVPNEDPENPWKTSGSEWMTVEVPVAHDGNRVVATGTPVFVGTPETSYRPASDKRGEDTALSEDTQTAAEAFFDAYGEGDVSAVIAPGAVVAAPLLTGWTVESITDWTVYKGDGEDREARAAVTWETEAGTAITQTYDLTITRVTGASGERWQISAIHGG